MYTPPKAPPDLMSSLALVLDMAKAHIKSLELQYGDGLLLNSEAMEIDSKKEAASVLEQILGDAEGGRVPTDLPPAFLQTIADMLNPGVEIREVNDMSERGFKESGFGLGDIDVPPLYRHPRQGH